MTTEQKEFLTTDEVADRLGVSAQTVWRWIKQGQLRGFKPGGKHYRIRQEDLDEFLASREVQPVKAPEEPRWPLLRVSDFRRRGVPATRAEVLVANAKLKTALEAAEAGETMRKMTMPASADVWRVNMLLDFAGNANLIPESYKRRLDAALRAQLRGEVEE